MFENYPAAHSMDTEWYAVDEDGHIAQFETGLEGAIPLKFSSKFPREEVSIFNLVINHLEKDEKGWFYIECDYNLVKDMIAEKADALEKYLTLKVKGKKKSKRKKKKSHAFTETQLWQTFLIVESEKTIDKLGVEGYTIYFDREKTIFCVEKCSLEKFKLAYKEGGIKGAYLYSFNDILWEDHLVKLLGFFVYEAVEKIGPYRRHYIPTNPTNIQDIPEPIKSNLSTVVFKGIKFKDYKRLQPQQHLESYSCSLTWIDYEGKERLFGDNRYTISKNVEWAATDASGCIAIFLTGGGGAIPVNLLDKFNSGTIIFDHSNSSYEENQICLTLDNSRDDLSLIKQRLIERSESLEDILQNAKTVDSELARALIVVDSQKSLKELEPKGSVVCFNPYNIVYVESCPIAKFEKVYRQGFIKGVISSYNTTIKASREKKELPEFLRFFIFKVARYSSYVTYQRVYSPPVPIKLDDMPEFLRPRLSDLCFTKILFTNCDILNVSEQDFIKSLSY